MTTIIRIPGYSLDTRGNRLLLAQTRALGTTGGIRLYVQAAKRVSSQITACLPTGSVALPLRPEDISNDWTHRWELVGPLPDDVRQVIGVLKEVLTLEHPRDVEAALALDFYSDPEETEAGTIWHRTTAGEMVNRGKYRKNSKVQENAWNEMASSLADVINRHPLLRGADAVISVPGHVTTEWRPGERVASRTARLVELPFRRTTAKHEVRPEAKDAEGSEEEFDLTDEFAVSLRSNDRTVIIVDDVLKSGRTMGAVAQAARRAGATTIYGLVCARTRRKG